MLQSIPHVRDLDFRQTKQGIVITMRVQPAPTTTLETPLHSVRKPSTLDIVTMAFDMPV